MASVAAQSVPLTNGRRALVRVAAETDAEAICALRLVLLEQESGLIQTLADIPETERTIAKQVERIADYRADPDRVLLVVEADGAVVGQGHIDRYRLLRRRHIGVLALGIRRSHQGLGLGRALIGRLLDWARTQTGLEKVALSVMADNAVARALYEKMGFVEEGRQRCEFRRGPDDYVDNVAMALFLPAADSDATSRDGPATVQQ